ncbi:MAG: HEAT repeat domain-containing protein [Maioricimonas sp. JB049]
MNRPETRTSRVMMRWTGCCLTAAGCLLAGCGGEPTTRIGEPASSTASAPPVENSNATKTAVVSPAPEPARISEDATSASVPLASAADRERAETALDRLVSPGADVNAWDTAQQTLIDLGPAAVPALAEALGDANPMRREMATMILALLGPQAEAAVPQLKSVLEDSSEFVRANAAAALTQIPGQAETVIPVLTRLLQSGNPELRKMAAGNLAFFGPEAAGHVPQLAVALEDQEPGVVLPVVELLGRIGPAAEPAAARLQQIVFERPGSVGEAASAALQQIRPAAGETESAP